MKKNSFISTDITDIFVGSEENRKVFENNLRVKVSQVLQFCNVPLHLQGYEQLMTGIMIGYQKPELLKSLTKGMYVTISDLCGVGSSTRVERVIRHAIEWACNNSEPGEGIYAIFGSTCPGTAGKPTNGQFLATIVNYMKLYYPNLEWDEYDDVYKRLASLSKQAKG